MSKRPDTSFAPSIGDVGADEFLGSPTVVAGILERFISEVFDLVLRRGDGSLTAEQMATRCHEMGAEFSRIFAGEDAEYTKINGWNTRTGGLSAYLMADLGSYWQSQRKAHNDDPYAVLFSLLVWHVFQAMKDGEDLAQARMADTINKTVRMLTGSVKRL